MSKSKRLNLWWDDLLDGRPHLIDLRGQDVQACGYRNPNAFRTTAHREAANRFTRVATYALTPWEIAVQAYTRADECPARTTVLASFTPADVPPLRQIPELPQSSSPTPAVPASPVAPETRPEIVPARTKENLFAPVKQLPADWLPPCTCGKAPHHMWPCELAGGPGVDAAAPNRGDVS
jgi:hypothetical protein